MTSGPCRQQRKKVTAVGGTIPLEFGWEERTEFLNTQITMELNHAQFEIVGPGHLIDERH
jgi:hypothetical protein